MRMLRGCDCNYCTSPPCGVDAAQSHRTAGTQGTLPIEREDGTRHDTRRMTHVAPCAGRACLAFAPSGHHVVMPMRASPTLRSTYQRNITRQRAILPPSPLDRRSLICEYLT